MHNRRLLLFVCTISHLSTYLKQLLWLWIYTCVYTRIVKTSAYYLLEVPPGTFSDTTEQKKKTVKGDKRKRDVEKDNIILYMHTLHWTRIAVRTDKDTLNKSSKFTINILRAAFTGINNEKRQEEGPLKGTLGNCYSQQKNKNISAYRNILL